MTAVATEPHTKSSTGGIDLSASTSSKSASVSRDLLSGSSRTPHRLITIAVLLVAVDIAAGWLYLTSYFGYFGLPIEALGLSAAEILAKGFTSMILPLTIIPVAVVAAEPARKPLQAALAVGGYVLFLSYLEFIGHFNSPSTILAQGAAMAAMAGAVFAMRRGFGGTAVQGLILAGVGLLLIASLPVAAGTLDAGQKASAKQSTLRIVTKEPVLPGSTVAGGQFSYSNYVLLREGDSSYWLLRLDNQHAYSIAKSAILYIRY